MAPRKTNSQKQATPIVRSKAEMEQLFEQQAKDILKEEMGSLEKTLKTQLNEALKGMVLTTLGVKNDWGNDWKINDTANNPIAITIRELSKEMVKKKVEEFKKSIEEKDNKKFMDAMHRLYVDRYESQFRECVAEMAEEQAKKDIKIFANNKVKRSQS